MKSLEPTQKSFPEPDKIQQNQRKQKKREAINTKDENIDFSVEEWLLEPKKPDKFETVPKIILPSSISKKEYKNPDNDYLPPAMYIDDMKKMFLVNVKAQNIGRLSGLLKIIKHVNFIEIDSNETPLTFAIKSQKKRSVRYLITKGANIKMKNGFGEDPLELALFSGRNDIVRILEIAS
ncbi:ankyrin repeat domain-containing protein [Anaplasmataceae bacterium AB001_6]|nr:ankyrin repeat domain-containing protein [Anaplasmataceae bacterium AB001_6]